MSNLLKDASILLTPTAYENGRMNATKPYKDLYGPELVINGDFSQGSQDWTFNTNGNNQWSVANEKASYLGTATDFIITNNVLTIGKKYLVSFDILDTNGSTIRLSVNSEAGGSFDNYTNGDGKYTTYLTANTNYLRIGASSSGASFSIDNVSVKEDLTGDFTFSRNSAATRVNAQGLVENVQILSPELVSNGNFSQIGTEEVSNGNFSQEGSELVTNGDFETDSDWTLSSGITYNSNGYIDFDGTQGAGQARNTPNITFVQGKTYKVVYEIKNYVSGNIKFRFQTGTNTIGQQVNGDGVKTEYIVCNDSSNNNFQFFNSPDFIGSIDNVSVKEVGQDWDLGTGWSIGDGVASCDGTQTGWSILQQNNILPPDGSIVKIVATVSNYSSGNLYIKAGFGDTGFQISSDGTFTTYRVVNGSSQFRLQADLNFIGSVTNISVKEVGQDWTFGSGWSVDQANSKAVSDTTASNLTPSTTLISGRKYKFSLNSEAVSSGSYSFLLRFNSTNTTVGTVNSDGSHEFVAIADSTSFRLQTLSGGSTNFSITNVSVKEITDDTDLPRIDYEGFSYQDSLGSEEVTNGDFATDSNWNKGTGWSIANGSANSDGTNNYDQLRQTNILTIGNSYKLTFDLTYISGLVKFTTPSVDSEYNSSGSYTLNFIADSANVVFTAWGAFTGSIDNVSVKEVIGQEVVPDSGCGSWLLEGQSTNTVRYSEEFSNAEWGQVGSPTLTSGQLAPDGTLSATKISGTIGSSYIALGTASSSTATRSIYAKTVSGTGTAKLMSYHGNTNNLFTLTEEWQRFELTGTTSTAGNASFYIDFRDNTQTLSEFIIWGAQSEELTYATSYIPTNGATNTRLQDIATNSGNSTLINSTEGVLYAEIARSTVNNDYELLSISPTNNSDGTHYASLGYNNTDNKLWIRAKIGNTVAIASIGQVDTVLNQFYKIAIKYKSGENAIYVDGEKLINTDITDGSEATTFTPTQNTISDLEFRHWNADNSFYGKVKALAVYKEALTDANLRCLTYPNPVATTFDLDFDTIAEQFTFTRGSEATFVNAQGLIESTASNDAPRIDYSTGAKAFLLEPQSTNLITQSELFSDSYWAKTDGLTVSSLGGGLSPNGVNNADLITVNNGRLNKDFSVINSTAYVLTAYYKGAVGDTLNMDLGAATKVVTLTGEWQKESISLTTTSTFIPINLIDNRTSGTALTVEVWGAQLEQKSYATSYIPTSGATATRNQELCNNATPVINSEEGTLYAEISALVNSGTNRAISLFEDGSNTVSLFYFLATNTIRALILTNGSTKVVIDFVLSDATDFNKIAFKYKENDCALWVNGIEVGTDVTATIPTALSSLNFDYVSNPFFGNTKGLKYYPKALADVQLEDLTTI